MKNKHKIPLTIKDCAVIICIFVIATIVACVVIEGHPAYQQQEQQHDTN